MTSETRRVRNLRTHNWQNRRLREPVSITNDMPNRKEKKKNRAARRAAAGALQAKEQSVLLVPQANTPKKKPPATRKPNKKPDNGDVKLSLAEKCMRFLAGGIVIGPIINHFSGPSEVLYVSALGLCVVIAWYLRKWPSLRLWMIPAYFLIVFGTHKYVQFEKQNQQPKEHPSLEPTLVIDGLTDKYVEYHYDLHNVGKATAYDIHYQEHSDEFVSIETAKGGKFLARELEADHHLSESPAPIAWQRKGDFFSRSWIVFYEEHSQSKTNEFIKEFKFFGPSSRITKGEIHFTSSRNISRN